MFVFEYAKLQGGQEGLCGLGVGCVGVLQARWVRQLPATVGQAQGRCMRVAGMLLMGHFLFQSS